MKKKKSDNIEVLWSVIIILCLLLLGTLGTLYFTKYKEYRSEQTAYLKIDKVIAQNADYSVSTNLSISSDPEGAEDLKDNQKQVKFLLEKTLSSTDLSNMDNQQKITAIQDAFQQALDKKFRHTEIKEVLITDFVLSNN